VVSVYTVGEICKKCYSCVRSAREGRAGPGGQSEIIEDFCISCGYCVNVCSQGAKRVVSSLPGAEILAVREKVRAPCPSFPALFSTFPPSAWWGAACRGFDGVYEVASAPTSWPRVRAPVPPPAAAERGGVPDLHSVSAVVQYVEKMLPSWPRTWPPSLPHGSDGRVVRQKLAGRRRS